MIESQTRETSLNTNYLNRFKFSSKSEPNTLKFPNSTEKLQDYELDHDKLAEDSLYKIEFGAVKKPSKTLEANFTLENDRQLKKGSNSNTLKSKLFRKGSWIWKSSADYDSNKIQKLNIKNDEADLITKNKDTIYQTRFDDSLERARKLLAKKSEERAYNYNDYDKKRVNTQDKINGMIDDYDSRVNINQEGIIFSEYNSKRQKYHDNSCGANTNNNPINDTNKVNNNNNAKPSICETVETIRSLKAHYGADSKIIGDTYDEKSSHTQNKQPRFPQLLTWKKHFHDSLRSKPFITNYKADGDNKHNDKTLETNEKNNFDMFNVTDDFDIQNYLSSSILHLKMIQPERLSQSRIIELVGIPPHTSLNNIMERISGGPLEKIEMFPYNRNDTSKFKKRKTSNSQLELESDENTFHPLIDWKKNGLRLNFLNHEKALKFYDFAVTAKFVINGHHVHPKIFEKDIHFENIISKRNDDEHREELEKEKEMLKFIETKGYSRILVFKKPVNHKKNIDSTIVDHKEGSVNKEYGERSQNNINNSNQHNGDKNARGRTNMKEIRFENGSKRRYPDPEVHYVSNFNIEEIRNDFMQYGKIIDILPIISRKMAFSIQFFDISSAVKAKRDCENGQNDVDEVEAEQEAGNFKDALARSAIQKEMWSKYRSWYIWFGKDPTDRVQFV
ncbi:hypothetical protein BVG19_g1704 [[Candida] boidinii]|nr:hypothetical protein BVG19_g1704 [[Candida] boidinii]OWB52373.1 hypothetical protein B5S27_g3948 [[Candida] boidinii]